MLKAKYRDRLLAIGVALAAVMGSVLGSVFGAAADVFPSRPITIVVPYAAGGLFDSIARALAESMRTALSQSVVIENVGGAGGSIALGRVARDDDRAPILLRALERFRRDAILCTGFLFPGADRVGTDDVASFVVNGGIRREAGNHPVDVVRVLCREIASKNVWQLGRHRRLSIGRCG